MQDILKRRNENQKIEPAERVALKEQYRKIKRFVSELERDNQQKIIIFPSLTNGTGWYKAIQFSALYYTPTRCCLYGCNNYDTILVLCFNVESRR